MKKRIRILLADDDRVDRMAVERLVREKELPYDLEIAASLAEGIEKLEKYEFDVILLDYQLGDGTGLDLMKNTKETPVIFVTGSGSEVVAVQAMRLGARDYLVKDPSRNYLAVLPLTVQNVIERRQSEEALEHKTKLIQLFQEITITANEARSVEEAMQICLDKVCIHTGWQVGHAYLRDVSGTLCPSSLWYFEEANRFETFRKITEDMSFDFGIGLPGRVLENGKPHWIKDVSKDENFSRAKLAKENNIKAGFAFPVLEGEKVVAVLEFFSESIIETDESMMESISMLATQLGRVTERKRMAKEIRDSLKEKEVLLKEIHHRVKNNMNVVVSLLRLQCSYSKDKKVLDTLTECQNRIKSMALIHEKLYQSKSLARIDFKEYIKNIVNGLFRSYQISTSKVLLKLEIEEVSLGIDATIPCALIVNELISNSLKYAFPGDKTGEIKLTLRKIADSGLRSVDAESEIQNPKSEIIEMIVSDNGVGISEGVDFRNTESLGLQLVTTLAEDQLQGKVELNRENGAEFRIRFKEMNDNKF